jgi:hypothetical protein
MIVDKEHAIQERAIHLTESKRELQADEGYTLAKLSQDEILVEFSDHSTANPPNWTAVRKSSLYFVHRIFKINPSHRKKSCTTPSWHSSW